jgi:hypothetical protein
MREVQEIDPAWRRSQSLRAPDSVEGEIAEAEAWSREARSRLSELAREPAESLMDAYRRQHGLDLLGDEIWSQDRNTVAHCKVGDEIVSIGVNSDAPSGYAIRDSMAATGMREELVKKYPELMSTDNVGQFPNDSLFHAEVTCLLRAMRRNGGTLEGQEVEMRVDREMCWRCEKVLPKVGLELGNPRVTVIDATGASKTMHNGQWLK